MNSVLLEDRTYRSELTTTADVSVIDHPTGYYSLLFVGGSGAGVVVVQDAASPTGWTQQSLPTNVAVGLLAGGVDAAGDTVVYGVGPNITGPDLYFTTRGSVTWPDWAPVPASDDIPRGMTISDIETIDLGGSSVLIASLSDATTTTAWQVAPAQDDKWTWTAIGAATAGMLAGATIGHRNGVVTLLPDSEAPPTFDLVFYPHPFDGSPPEILASGVSATALASGPQPSGSSLVFVTDKSYVSGGPTLAYLDGGAPSKLVHVDITVPVDTMVVGSDGAGSPALFATGVNGRLYVWQPAVKNDEGVAIPFDLGLSLVATAAATRADGSLEVVCVNPLPGVTRLWEADEGGASGPWETADVELPATRLDSHAAHSTVFSLTDVTGAALVDTPVFVNSEEVVAATAAGFSGLLGPSVATKLSTDHSGRLRITVPGDGLATSRLKLSLADPGAGRLGADTDWIVPNSSIPHKLANVSTSDVAEIIGDASKAAGVQQALVELGKINYEDHVSDAEQSGSPSPWRLTIDRRGGATFSELTRSEVAAAWAASGSPSDVTGFLSDLFDDVLEAADTAVDAILKYTIDPLVEGFDALLELTIDGASWSARATIKLVEEGLEVADAILDAAGAARDRVVALFGWLLSDAKADIWATKSALEGLLTQAPAHLAAAARDAKSHAAEFWSRQHDYVDTKFDQIIAEVGADPLDPPSLGAPHGNPLADAFGELESVVTWLWDKLTSLEPGLDDTIAPPSKLADDIGGLISNIGSECVQKVTGDLDDFQTQVRRYAASSGDLAGLLLKTVLEGAKGLILAATDVADAVTEQFLAVVAEMLDWVGEDVLGAPIEDPIAQDLYDLFNPGSSEDVTLAGLSGLLLALPTTVLYRAIYDEPPFPRGVEASQGPVVDFQTGRRIAGIITFSLWTGADVYLDVRSPRDPVPKKTRLENVVVANLLPLTIQTIQWPGGPFTYPFRPRDEVELASMIAWGCGFLPMSWNLLITAISNLEQTARAREFCPALAFLGTLSMVANVIKCAYETADGKGSVEDWVLAFSGPLPLMAKPLKVAGYVTPLVIVDAVCDAATGVMKMAQD